MKSFRSWSGLLIIPLALLVSTEPSLAAAESESDITRMKDMLRVLIEQNEKQQQQIDDLQRRLDEAESGARSQRANATRSPEPAEPAIDPLDAALAELDIEPPAPPTSTESQAPAIVSRRLGNANVRLIDMSFDVLTAAGSSSERGSTLRDLQGGAHDPNRRGFTLQQGEFSLIGAVDPFFTAEAHVIFGTDFIELEEAFFTTTSLPYDLQLEGGLFFTEFGRINPVHPHAWKWVDQPIINTRLFGGDGLRSPGASLSWLTPLPWYSELVVGAQNADEGELTFSFNNGDTGVGGRPAVDTEVRSFSDLLYHARSANSWDLSSEVTTLLGFSGLFGSNSTGRDGTTFIYGADLTIKWLPENNFRGWPFLLWQTEITKRDFNADGFTAGTELEGGGDPHGHGAGAGEPDGDGEDTTADLPGRIVRDWGGYSQLLWGFRSPWAAGVRLEYASGAGPSVTDGQLDTRRRDPMRGDRFRISPLLIYHPTHFSRLRLQYNLDHARFLGGNDLGHSVWLSAEFLYGAHTAHEY